MPDYEQGVSVAGYRRISSPPTAGTAGTPSTIGWIGARVRSACVGSAFEFAADAGIPCGELNRPEMDSEIRRTEKG